MTDIPGQTWRTLAARRQAADLPKGLDAAWDAAVAVGVRCLPRTARFLRDAGKVLTRERHYADMTDARLAESARAMRERFRRGRDRRADRIDAMALVREVAFRQLGERPFRVQVAGALAMMSGCIAEMATGEGKTLTATLPATIAGWRGRGCHVITVNDYLAQRDAEWMGRVYRFCGLRVGYVCQGMDPSARRAAYQADITYATNKEVTADFLRDRLALGRVRTLPQALLSKLVDGAGGALDRLVQRGLHTAIVDEADSVLIDEAVTPLIISGQAPNPEQVAAFQQAATLGAALRTPAHYRVRRQYREVDLTDAGRKRLAELTAEMGGVWRGIRRAEELVVQALTAGEFYLRDKQYVVQEEKIVIVDEFTGRLMPDREWRDGLHQAVAAKERLEVEPPKDTYARVSFQRFFRMYPRLSGMTGTAAEAWREFWQIYRLPVAVIPTNRPCAREVLRDRVFAADQARWRAVAEEVRRVHDLGRPVLVGTRSVRASEHLSALLTECGLAHRVLNAVRHKEEAEIVAGAGGAGKITVATNMAGRGTDIKLGRGVAERGGLHVIATERHESGRIDRQLFGRCARQGDPGSAQAFASLDDDLLVRHAPRTLRWLKGRFGQTDREISSALTRRAFNAAQRRAERLAFTQRKSVLRTDDWIDEYLGFAAE